MGTCGNSEGQEHVALKVTNIASVGESATFVNCAENCFVLYRSLLSPTTRPLMWICSELYFQAPTRRSDMCSAARRVLPCGSGLAEMRRFKRTVGERWGTLELENCSLGNRW